MWHAREKTIMCIGLGWGNLKEEDFFEDLVVVWKDNIQVGL